MDPNDNTAIIDMKKNFQRFLTDDDSRKRSRLDLSEASLMDSSRASVNQSYSRDPDSLQNRTDLIYFKSRIGMMESQLNHKETELKEQAILHERELSELKCVHDRELRGYSVLKTSHERVLLRQELCEADLKDEKEALAHAKVIYDDKILQLQNSNREKDMSYTQLMEEEKAKYRELRNKYMTQQAELSVANSELGQLKDQLSDMKKRLNDSLESSMESGDWKVRATHSEERLAHIQSELDEYKDDMLVMAARKRDLAKLSQVTEENKKLHKEVNFYKVTTDNVEVMKEKVRTMERKCQNYEDLQMKVARLEVENEDYCSKVLEMQEKQIADDTVVRLREAQEKEAVMLENIGDLKSRNRGLEFEIREMEKSRTDLQSKLSGADTGGELKSSEIAKLQRKIVLLTKERDGFKTILDSYESEVTREIVTHTSDKQAQLQKTLNSYMKANEELERALESKEKENVDLRLIAQEANKAPVITENTDNEISTANKIDQSQILDLRLKVENLEKQYEKLSEEKEILETRIEQRHMQGDYDPTKTKVVHFSMNPAALAQETRANELKLLRESHTKLCERVKVLEKNLAEAHDITAQVDANLNNSSVKDSQQFKEIKSKLASSEKKCEKLIDMFKQHSLEFRQITYQLTGYRIDTASTKQYKLMNMYSSSSEDYLIFQETSEGELQLLGNDYATTLTELAEEHLHNQGSIPVFLSSLTLDLYKQSTMMG